MVTYNEPHISIDLFWLLVDAANGRCSISSPHFENRLLNDILYFS